MTLNDMIKLLQSIANDGKGEYEVVDSNYGESIIDPMIWDDEKTVSL